MHLAMMGHHRNPGHNPFPSSDHVGATTFDFDVVGNGRAHALAEKMTASVYVFGAEMRNERILGVRQRNKSSSSPLHRILDRRQKDGISLRWWGCEDGLVPSSQVFADVLGVVEEERKLGGQARLPDPAWSSAGIACRCWMNKVAVTTAVAILSHNENTKKGNQVRTTHEFYAIPPNRKSPRIGRVCIQTYRMTVVEEKEACRENVQSVLPLYVL
ncbi:hypothetical protein ARMSODRAFT_983193 [Armillaria solidipes]|uniref:Uncharacterized protein n=1 Tax=Armillaria solidipes TaxID=1076256 RepID=A0A2H3B874_9AGAR|nr:hypothetical protein ARMSODRAFT_983193 [Armillaria solidipes]